MIVQWVMAGEGWQWQVRRNPSIASSTTSTAIVAIVEKFRQLSAPRAVQILREKSQVPMNHRLSGRPGSDEKQQQQQRAAIAPVILLVLLAAPRAVQAANASSPDASARAAPAGSSAATSASCCRRLPRKGPQARLFEPFFPPERSYRMARQVGRTPRTLGLFFRLHQPKTPTNLRIQPRLLQAPTKKPRRELIPRQERLQRRQRRWQQPPTTTSAMGTIRPRNQLPKRPLLSRPKETTPSSQTSLRTTRTIRRLRRRILDPRGIQEPTCQASRRRRSTISSGPSTVTGHIIMMAVT